MDCREAQEHVLDSFQAVRSAERERDLETHFAECPVCASFAAKQKGLDARLTELFVDPEMSPAFRSALHRRIRRERARLWSEALPDIVHFGSCAAATVISAVSLPYASSTVLTAGVTATVVTYLLLAVMRNLMADSEVQ